jgi:MFS family permease
VKKRFKKVIDQTFSSLRTRNFRLFFYGQLVSNTGNWLTNIAITLLVLHITNSGFAVGVLVACQYGPILLLSVWAGTIADRSNKRRLLMTTQFFEMLQSFALGAIAFLPHKNLGLIYAVAIFGGLFLSFDMPVRRSFVTEMVSKEDRANAVVLNSAMVNTSRIFGPALAGALVVTVGYGWCFTIDAISYLFVLYSLARMDVKKLNRTPIVERAKGQVREGLKYIASVPELWINFVTLAFVGTLSYNFSVIFPLFVTKALHGGDGNYTIIYVTFSIGALVASLLAAYRRTVGMRQVIFGLGCLGITMLVLSASPNIFFAIVVVFFVGLSSITYMTATTSIVQVRGKASMHGRILAIQAVLLIGTTPIGGPILGAVSDTFGPRIPLIIGGVTALINAVGGVWLFKKYRKPTPVDREQTAESLQVVTSQTSD